MPDLKIWSQKEISKLKSNLDRLFDDFCADFTLPSARAAREPTIYVDDGDRLIARLEIPDSMDTDSLRLQVTERTIIIQCRSVQVSGNALRRNTFRKELRLPCRILPDDVKARFDKGILEVSMPKCACPVVRNVHIERR